MRPDAIRRTIFVSDVGRDVSYIIIFLSQLLKLRILFLLSNNSCMHANRNNSFPNPLVCWINQVTLFGWVYHRLLKSSLLDCSVCVEGLVFGQIFTMQW